MYVVSKKRIVPRIIDFAAAFSVILTFLCIFLKIKDIGLYKEKISILAVKSIFYHKLFSDIANLNKKYAKTSENKKISIDANNRVNETDKLPEDFNDSGKTPKSDESKIITKTEVNPPIQPHENEQVGKGPTHKIIETQIKSGGTRCENFYVKNTTGQDVDFLSELNKSPSINIKNTSDPQVLIFHTHTSESYMDKDVGFFYDNFYPRTLNNERNVIKVGQAITDKLNENGIKTIHDITYHDSPTYNGSYSRSAQTIEKNLRENQSIQVVIDIHRDSMGSNDSGKLKPTFVHNGKKAAQIMIISGCDSDGTLGFPNWKCNLNLALKLQNCCENMFPGITRPLKFANVKYNENLTKGSLLIEVGSDMNTLDEAVYTGSLLGESLSKLLNDLKK